MVQICGDDVMLPGTTTMRARLRDSDARYLRQVKFNVKFVHGELYECVVVVMFVL